MAWVKVDGCANHENAACIRQFLTGRFEQGWRRFVIDLAGCPGIDSTFIGMLCRLARRIAEVDPEGVVDVINPGTRNATSIRKLGLDSFIHLDLEGKRWLRERALVEENLRKPVNCALDRREHAEFVLQAHEALVAANEENRSRFCDVVDFLRQEVEATAGEK